MTKDKNRQKDNASRPAKDGKQILEDIQRCNDHSGLQKVSKILMPIITTINGAIFLFTGLALFAHFANGPILSFAEEYITNPICAINALLLVVLNIGHDRYFDITSETLNLSDYMFLQVIDFVIKVSLLIVTILQCIEPEWFIGICLYGYLLTLCRVFYLHIKLERNHPILARVDTSWYPNNIRHVKVMLIWFALYYGLIKTNIIYYVISYLVDCQINYKSKEIMECLYIVRLFFIVVFDCYWIYRVLRKVVVQKNSAFKSQYEIKLREEVSDYYGKMSD